MRSEIIPSYAQSVTFTIARNELTDDRRNEVEGRFPGVAIAVDEPSSSQTVTKPNDSAKRRAAPGSPLKKPNGVKTAIFELDRDEVSKNHALEGDIRKQWPWTTVVMSPNIPTGPRALRQAASSSSDAESHLQEFAFAMADYPPDGMFDVNVRRDETWTALPFSRKTSIAHARAIQVGLYSETRVPSMRCETCKRNNYTCKTYRHDFIKEIATTSHISLGEGCQHCRLLGNECDLIPTDPQLGSSQSGNNVGEIRPRGFTRAFSVATSSEATVTPRGPSQSHVAHRTSVNNLPPVSNVGADGFTRKTDMIEIAQKLGLILVRPDVVWTMYTAWKEHGSFRNYTPGLMNLQYYCKCAFWHCGTLY